ncbi:hypothetical protein SAMN06309944_0214 [Micrococcales bacterium KH10]|nr:hypothetical protein SAMN06309944_0214 [Micrococcales bacterium KH10]
MRLYKARYVGKAATMFNNMSLNEWPEPEGWREYAIDKWGKDFTRWTNGYKPFFLPSDQPIYRSRSAAQNRVNLINRWLGEGSAILVETDTNWMPTADANRIRKAQRKSVRIAKLKAEIARLEEASA